jgi:SAM-dependent methyltransferase
MNPASTAPDTALSIEEMARCLACGVLLQGEPRCPRCRRNYPVRDGILEAIGPLSGRNLTNAAFYDGPGWARFRRWERGFLMLQGGPRKARMEILRHLCRLEGSAALGLEVGIGDGENVALLPPRWAVYGVDIARTRLQACRRRHPALEHHLAWAEAENLPFAEATFDASWTIGGFNYFRDHEAALRELRRVTKPGGPVVVADETPGLKRAGLGHLLGVPSFDAWWLNKLGLDRDFVRMVLDFDVDLEGLIKRIWPGAAHHRIWYGLGYCVVNTSMS